LRLDPFESFSSLLHPEHSSPFETAGLHHAFHQLLRNDQDFVANLNKRIVDIPMQTDRLIGRECPGVVVQMTTETNFIPPGNTTPGNVWLSTVEDVTSGNFT
jgi:hypothetical protein